MARQKLTPVESTRDGSNKITKVTIDAVGSDGLMLDGSTQDICIVVDNVTASPIAFEIVNAPGQEAKVDQQSVANKVPATLAAGETFELGPFPLQHYGNDDPDDSGIASGKAILIDITSGDAAEVWARKDGSLS